MTRSYLKCSCCGVGLVLMDGFYMCPVCGNDYRVKSKVRFDEYWTHYDERQIGSELDDFFYMKYPMFKRI